VAFDIADVGREGDRKAPPAVDGRAIGEPRGVRGPLAAAEAGRTPTPLPEPPLRPDMPLPTPRLAPVGCADFGRAPERAVGTGLTLRDAPRFGKESVASAMLRPCTSVTMEDGARFAGVVVGTLPKLEFCSSTIQGVKLLWLGVVLVHSTYPV
jgi:hypothetical protein